MDRFFPLEPLRSERGSKKRAENDDGGEVSAAQMLPPSTTKTTTKDDLISDLYQGIDTQTADVGVDQQETLSVGQSLLILKIRELDQVDTDDLEGSYVRVLRVAAEIVGVSEKDVFTAVTAIENRVKQRWRRRKK
jgi:hypothetical protein